MHKNNISNQNSFSMNRYWLQITNVSFKFLQCFIFYQVMKIKVIIEKKIAESIYILTMKVCNLLDFCFQVEFMRKQQYNIF